MDEEDASMWNIHHRRHNIFVSILTCICLGNLLLYIAFTNLQTEYLRRERKELYRISSNINNSILHYKQSDGEKYNYVIKPSLLCNRNVELVIVICSSLNHFIQRQIIRETWGNITIDRNVKIVFLIGRWPENRFSKIKTQLWNESYKYRDIVQADFIDSYSNLTLKSMFMLHWVKTFCSDVKYLLKSDDDMYINVQNLFQALDKQVATKFVMGHLITEAKPIQDPNSKWYTPKSTFPNEHYPPYLSGTAYVISGSAISDIFKVAERSKLFWLEDIFITGICAETVNVYHIHRSDMTYNLPISYDCKLKSLISLHEVKWKIMPLIHNFVVANEIIPCDKE